MEKSNVFLKAVEEKEFTIELITKLLGTVPKNKEVYAAHIAAKGKELHHKSGKTDEEIDAEAETVEEIEEKGWTGFMSDESGLFIYEHMIIGFLKSACEVAMTSKIIPKLPAYKKWFDKIMIVTPRRIRLKQEGVAVSEADGRIQTGCDGRMPSKSDGQMEREIHNDTGKPVLLPWKEVDGVLERPLRAMTAQGPRVTVTRSDYIESGRQIRFTIGIMKNDKKVTMDLIDTLLQYGEICGLGQWRGSGGYGRFKVI